MLEGLLVVAVILALLALEPSRDEDYQRYMRDEYGVPYREIYKYAIFR